MSVIWTVRQVGRAGFELQNDGDEPAVHVQILEPVGQGPDGATFAAGSRRTFFPQAGEGNDGMPAARKVTVTWGPNSEHQQVVPLRWLWV